MENAKSLQAYSAKFSRNSGNVIFVGKVKTKKAMA